MRHHAKHQTLHIAPSEWGKRKCQISGAPQLCDDPLLLCFPLTWSTFSGRMREFLDVSQPMPNSCRTLTTRKYHLTPCPSTDGLLHTQLHNFHLCVINMEQAQSTPTLAPHTLPLSHTSHIPPSTSPAHDLTYNIIATSHQLIAKQTPAHQPTDTQHQHQHYRRTHQDTKTSARPQTTISSHPLAQRTAHHHHTHYLSQRSHASARQKCDACNQQGFESPLGRGCEIKARTLNTFAC